MAKPMLISPISRQGIKLVRVAAYCRVSSSSADQLNSYATQIDYYTRLAKKKKNEGNMVEIFADEGISGMKAKNRPEFQRMIRMCELHQLDLIITKSVSRFARNVKEALEYVRKLKFLGVGIIFEKEGINTQSLGDEMLLNTFTAIAQEESKAISQNQRLSIVKRMELGIYVDSNAPYGFRLENKQLVEYPPEADTMNKELVTMTIEIDKEVYNQATELFKNLGTTIEDMTVGFLKFCVIPENLPMLKAYLSIENAPAEAGAQMELHHRIFKQVFDIATKNAG